MQHCLQPKFSLIGVLGLLFLTSVSVSGQVPGTPPFGFMDGTPADANIYWAPGILASSGTQYTFPVPMTTTFTVQMKANPVGTNWNNTGDGWGTEGPQLGAFNNPITRGSYINVRGNGQYQGRGVGGGTSNFPSGANPTAPFTLKMVIDPATGNCSGVINGVSLSWTMPTGAISDVYFSKAAFHGGELSDLKIAHGAL